MYVYVSVPRAERRRRQGSARLYTHTYIHTYTHTYTHTHIHVSGLVRDQLVIHTYTATDIHTHIHTSGFSRLRGINIPGRVADSTGRRR